MNRIGIMGGTFNPPHTGHLIMAEYSKDELSLDKVIFLPTGRISYKEEAEVLPKHRFEMTRLAIDNNSNFDISDMEYLNKEYSYTADSLEIIKSMYKNSHLFFIVGADSLDYMDAWKSPERLFSLCTVVAVGRYGFEKNQNIKKAEELKEKFNADIVFLDMPQIDLSSSEIRERLKNNKSVKYMVTDKVLEYIKENELY